MSVSVNYGGYSALSYDTHRKLLNRAHGTGMKFGDYAARQQGRVSYTYNQPQVQQIQTSDRGNSCTDGKDDGEIGFFSAVGNIAQGVVKQAGNMLKGAFCDENGFSIARTLRTVAVGAVCAACPAVGFALAGFGMVAGGTKLVSSTVKALNSKTDAEAKDAWEEVGEGGLTVGVSVIGAKASYGAIKARGTALQELGENASFGQWAKALWKDSKSTTSEGLGNIWNGLKDNVNAIKEYRQAKFEYESIKEADLGKLETYRAEGKLGKAEANLENTTFGKLTAQAKSGLNKVGESLKHPAQAIKSVGSKAFNAAQKTAQSIKNNGFHQTTRAIVKNFGDTGLSILKALQDENASYNQLVAQYGYENVIGVLEVLGTYTAIDSQV